VAEEKKVCRMVDAPQPDTQEPAAADSGMELLTREEMLAMPVGGAVHAVAVPEWGARKGVLILEWTGAQRDRFEGSLAERKDRMQNFRARLISAVVCDEQGRLVFSPEDVVDLGRKSAKALDRIFSAAMELNGLSSRDVEEMEKNSGGAVSGDSGSSIPSG